MSSDVVNRQTIREEFGSLLNAKLVVAEESAQVLYTYQVADFEAASPVVVISSSGSLRSKLALNSISNSLVYLDIHLFVAYTMTDAEGVIVWSEEDSENRLDLLEKQVFDVVIDNLVHLPYWSKIEEVGRSTIGDTPIAGEGYRHEIIPLAFQKVGS